MKICFGSNRIVLVGEKWVYKIPLSRRGQKANEQEYEAFLNNIDIVAYSEPRWYGLRQERLHDLVILPRDAGESEVPEHLVPLFRRKLHNRFQVGRTVYGVWKYFDYEDIKFYSRKENESQNYEEKTK